MAVQRQPEIRAASDRARPLGLTKGAAQHEDNAPEDRNPSVEVTQHARARNSIMTLRSQTNFTHNQQNPSDCRVVYYNERTYAQVECTGPLDRLRYSWSADFQESSYRRTMEDIMLIRTMMSALRVPLRA